MPPKKVRVPDRNQRTLFGALEAIVSGLKGIVMGLQVLINRDDSDAVAAHLLKELQKPTRLYALFLMAALLPILRMFSKSLQDPAFCFSEIISLRNYFAEKIRLLIDSPKEQAPRYASSYALINDLGMESVEVQTEEKFTTWHNEQACPYLNHLLDSIGEMMGESPALAACAVFDPRSPAHKAAFEHEEFNIEPLQNEIAAICRHFTEAKQYSFPTDPATLLVFPPLWTEAHLNMLKIEIEPAFKHIREAKLETLSHVLQRFLGSHELQQQFPATSKLLELISVLPLSTASVERLFSKVRLVRTRLRSCMSDEKLNQILLVMTEATFDEQGIPVDTLHKYMKKFLEKPRQNQYASLDEYIKFRDCALTWRRRQHVKNCSTQTTTFSMETPENKNELPLEF